MGQSTKVVVGRPPVGVFFGNLHYLALRNRFALVIGSEPLLEFELSDVDWCDRSGSLIHLKGERDELEERRDRVQG